MRLMVAMCALLVFTNCGGPELSPTAPTSPTSSSSSASGIPLSMYLQTNGIGVSFRVTLNGDTYTANGIFPLRLSPGRYTLTGSFTPTGVNVGEGLIIGFQSSFTDRDSGGVLSGSVRRVSGPTITSGLCSIGYGLLTASRTAQTFQMEFEVTTNTNGSCQLGG